MARADKPARLHDQFCRCARCRPPAPSDRGLTANERALAMLAGVVVGLVLAWLLDRAIGGPGVAIMFGRL